jgi:tetratricopeptide (TPR) repeat protein
VGSGPALSALPAPGSADPRTELAIATRLLGADQEEAAKRYLDALTPARAPELQDDLDLRTARFLTAPSREGLLWLLAHGAPVGDWLYPSLDLCSKDADLRAAVRSAVLLALPHATAAGAADLLDGLATLSQQEGGKDAPTLWLSAALLLESAVSADPSLRRAYGTSIADLYARGGALDEASRVLREDMTIYPAEFTWPYALADLLLDAGKPADALEYALAAQTASYGDNRLRAVDLVARVMDALGRGREALAIIDEALANAPKPADDLDVRTHRYLERLASTRAAIAARLGP